MRTITDALAQAAATAGYAPSIHNSQPWHWRIHDEVLDLYADHSRRLAITDPDGRLATLSCGVALHHARAALSAEGWDARVTLLPDPADPGHLASITTAGRIPVTARAIRRVQTIEIRHTDRRPVTATRVDGDELTAVTAAVERQGARLHVVPADRVVELAAAVSYAQHTEAAEDAWRAELAYWSGGTRPTGAGVPDAAIPDRPTQTTVASRDFGHPGALPVGTEHDKGATFAILYGERDCPADWLRAGEALSDAWLTATELGLSMLPLSAATEVSATRLLLRHLLAGLGEPYLVLRLGVADPDHAGAPHTPRLAARQTVERA